MPFDAQPFLKEYIQWSHLHGYLKDRSSQRWVLSQAGEGQPKQAPNTGPAMAWWLPGEYQSTVSAEPAP